MGSKKSTCLWIDEEVLEAARRMGLNISKVSENALVEMIGRLKGPETGTGLRGQALRDQNSHRSSSLLSVLSRW